MKLCADQIKNERLVKWHGRIYQVDQKTHFFYTGSGFSLRFNGSKLRATFDVSYASEKEKPYITVFVKSENKTETFLYALDHGVNQMTLYEGKSSVYDIEIRKRAESMHSRSSLIEFETDGAFEELFLQKKKYTIEWIGDSLTCGYGNLGATPDTPFDTIDEDGLKAFAVSASNILDADYQIIAVSGIGVYKSLYQDVSMPDIYEKYDIFDEKPYLLTKKQDLIVIDLGSNDNTYLSTLKGKTYESEKEAFLKHYILFLERLHFLNPESKILCISHGNRRIDADSVITKAYQKMDHKIYHHLRVSDVPVSDGIGSQYHPLVITHQRWAKEIAKKIEEIM